MELSTLNLPVLALRGLTVFPDLTLSFDVEREISIYALDCAMEADRRIFLVTQREIGVMQPQEEDLYEVGTVCHILQIIKTSDSSVRVVVQGESRAHIRRLWQLKPFLQANVELLEEDFPGKFTNRTEALLRRMEENIGCVRRDQVTRKAVDEILDAAAELQKSSDPTVSPLAGRIISAAQALKE